ncbi:MAG: hypothetical protein ACK55I_46445, partial [bacterium]
TQKPSGFLQKEFLKRPLKTDKTYSNSTILISACIFERNPAEEWKMETQWSDPATDSLPLKHLGQLS